MFSPSFKSIGASPFLPQSPNPNSSPYRLPPIPKSTSSNDLVSGIVEKFNSLSVMDRDEERERHQREVTKLKAALERACMAREEAEEEAQRLREKMLQMQEERVREREELRLKSAEWEKKYEKAKDRFKQQRTKNDEAMSRARAEFLEKEKTHWRSVAVAHEAEEWERKQKADANELIAFLELERRFAVESASRASLATLSALSSPVVTAPTPVVPQQVEAETVTVEATVTTTLLVDVPAVKDRSVTPDGPPSLPLRTPYRTPSKQTQRVRVDFGDAEADKENAPPAVEPHCQPSTPAAKTDLGLGLALPKTPVTMDRAAALAAIEYRRGRARSFMAQQMTPKAAAGLVDKREVSAPAYVTMSVGRKGR